MNALPTLQITKNPVFLVSDVPDDEHFGKFSTIRLQHIIAVSKIKHSVHKAEGGKVQVFFNIRTVDNRGYTVTFNLIEPEFEKEAKRIMRRFHQKVTDTLIENKEDFICIGRGKFITH